MLVALLVPLAQSLGAGSTVVWQVCTQWRALLNEAQPWRGVCERHERQRAEARGVEVDAASAAAKDVELGLDRRSPVVGRTSGHADSHPFNTLPAAISPLSA